MAINTNQVISLILKEARRTFKNNCPFIGSMSRDYDETNEAKGSKEGEEIRIRKPMKYSVREGKVMQVQGNTETEAVLSKSVIRGVDLKFSWPETTQELTRVQELYVRPAAAVLASKVEQYAMTLAYKQVYNTITLPTTNFDRADVIAAGTKLNRFSTPMSERFGVLDPESYGDLLNENASIFNPTAEIARQYTEGYMGKAYGFSLAQTPNVPSMTNSADVAGAVNGASQTGSTLTVDGLTVAPTEGAVFTIADVYALNPVTQESTGKLQEFVVGSGATTTSIPITPAITVSGNQKTVDSSPADDAAITFIGSASTAYPQQMFYHRLAFAFGTTKLQVPRNLVSQTTMEDNLSMTFTSGGDIINMDELHRLDILFGFVTVIPEWACKAYGI